MFPFFRKDKGGDRPVIPDAGAPRPAERHGQPAAEPAMPAGAANHNGLVVQEFGYLLAPEVEEAVMLYANGRVGEATAALNRFILNHPEQRDMQPWRLLFDLYEVTGQRQPFEDLALDFAVRFERSPPTWRPPAQAPSTPSGDLVPSFAFGAALSPQEKAGLEHFLKECETADTATLDFNKTPVPGNAAHARTLLDCLTALSAAGKAVRLTGADGFLVRLNAARSADRLDETSWLLLLMLLQLQGKEKEFEAAALDYAIRFEISPPSFTPPRQTPAEVEPVTGPSGPVFPLRGRLDPGAASDLEELARFAAPLAAVEVDLAQVSRIDFTVVGLLLDVVIRLSEAGKTITFRDGNEMVCLLLQMIGIGQYARIQPRTRI